MLGAAVAEERLSLSQFSQRNGDAWNAEEWCLPNVTSVPTAPARL